MAYHIKKDGTPGICNAQQGNCPLGGTDGHFDTIEQAQEYADKLNEREHGLFQKSVTEMSSSEFQEYAMQASHEVLTEDINTINETIENTKSPLKKNILNKRVLIATNALDGINITELENEKKRKVEAERKAKAEVTLNNALSMKNASELKLPKKMERYIVNKPWARVKVNAYRGELDVEERVEGGNTGMALYGSGVYSTTDKSYAEKYGKVRKADTDELPVRPLWVETVTGFDQLEYELAEEHNTTKGDINNNLEIEEYVTKMGYDGVVVGTGKDMIIVNFDTERNKHLFK